MTEVSLLFEEFVLNIDKNITINKIEYINSDTHIFTCNTKWARKGKVIKLGIDEQTSMGVFIKEVIKDEKIIVANAYSPISVELTNPFPISGTKTSTNNEWNNADSDLMKKTPLVWLYHNYTQTIYGAESSLERTMNLSIAFLDETNPLFQKNSDHIDNVVVPMTKLVEEFIKSIDKLTIYKKLKQHSIKVYSRFGIETDSGIIQNILDADLGGVVLTITLDKFKEPCKC
jgi:hypothetical protein